MTWHRLTQTQRCFAASLLLLVIAAGAGHADQPPAPTEPTKSGEQSPPPAYLNNQVLEARPQSTEMLMFHPAALSPLTRYTIGEPTPEEQLYLECINRARANPSAEAVRLQATTDSDVLAAYRAFGVDTSLMASQISAIPVYPPLSFNSNLLFAARSHTADQFTNSFQGHLGSDGSSPAERVARTGYPWTAAGENAFTAARSVLHGHAGFEVDWGASTGGMQTPPGHRNNIHGGSFREAGIGVINGTRGSVGPQLVTQEFATRTALPPLITGVIYYDLNGNEFYDLGEGVGGVTVNVSGSTWFAVSANAGGYTVPVPGNGTYTVTFTAPNLPAFTRTVTVSGNNNVKVDYLAPYSAPLITGPVTPLVGRVNDYTFTPVGAASAYQWKQSTRIPALAVEGAENGLVNITTILSTNYDLIQSSTKASGNFGFRLAHPQPVDQSVILNWIIRPTPTGQLVWANRLTWASGNQVARVQVTTNFGVNWENLWSMAGNNSAGQSAFVRTTNSLAAYAGMEIQVRFLYDHLGGSYYNQTSSGIGWYFDDIGFNNCEQLINTLISDVPVGTGFGFTPAASTNYSLRVHARIGDHYVDWGPALLPNASRSVPLTVRITSQPIVAANRAMFNFVVPNGTGGTFAVETSATPGGPWSRDNSATITTLISGDQYRANCATSTSGRCFYRVVSR